MYGDRGGTPASYTHRKQRRGPSYVEIVAGYDNAFLLYQLKAVLSYGFEDNANVIRAEIARRGLDVEGSAQAG